jgi:hypothetical protein
MKKAVCLAAVLMAVSGVASAQSSANGVSTSTNTNGSTSTSLGENQQVIQFDSPGDETLHTTPQVYVPSPANSLAQANCMVIPTVGASFINFGFAASIPVDGLHCDWRQNTAMALNTYANFRAFMTTPGLSDASKNLAGTMAEKALREAVDMQCLNSDRQRAVMERLALCDDVKDMATLDHRWNQPRNYQVDYSGQQ